MALGISYVLTGTVPPAEFFLLMEVMGLGQEFADACFAAADALEAQGEAVVLDYLEAYGAFLMGDEDALVVRYTRPEV